MPTHPSAKDSSGQAERPPHPAAPGSGLSARLAMLESQLEVAMRAGERVQLGFEFPTVLTLTLPRIAITEGGPIVYDNPHYDPEEEARARRLFQNKLLWDAACDLRGSRGDPAAVEQTVLNVLTEHYGDQAERLLRRAVCVLREYDGKSGWPLDHLTATLGETLAREQVAGAISGQEFEQWLELGSETWQRWVPATRIRATIREVSGREPTWDVGQRQTLQALVKRAADRLKGDRKTLPVLQHRWAERKRGKELFALLRCSERTELNRRRRALDVLYRTAFSAD